MSDSGSDNHHQDTGTAESAIKVRARPEESPVKPALEAGHIGFWDWNVSRGELLYHDPLGLEAAKGQVLGHACLQQNAVHGEDVARIEEAIQEHLEGQTPFYETEHRLRTESGKWRWVLCRGKVVERTVSGDPARICGVHVDITEQRRSQEETELRRQQLVQAEQLVSLGHLTAGIAHEINNPNHVIMSYAHILGNLWAGVLPLLERHAKENGDFDIAGSTFSQLRTEVPHMCSSILTSSKRIAAIVRELRNYGREESSSQKTKDQLNKVLQSALVLLSGLLKKSTARFSVSYGENLPEVMIDYQQVERAIVSLVKNACEALSDMTQAITIETCYDSTSNQVVLTVADEGAGMSSDVLSCARDPFFTTRRETGHTGLGLSITARIIAEHGGSLFFSSEAGKGTVATISLPAVEG